MKEITDPRTANGSNTTTSNVRISRNRARAAYLTVIICWIGFGAGEILAAPGDLDLTFGKQGIVLTDIAITGHDYFFPITESMLVQPDGKILVCGRFWEDGISSWYGTFITRYMPDGTLDASFGENGIVAIIGPQFPYGAQAVGADIALQPDGKIVLIGEISIAAGIVIQRYSSSGELDTSFGFNGTAYVPRDTLPGNVPIFPLGNSITVQPDGKIIGTGWEYSYYWDPANYYDAIVLFRMNSDGTMDSSFGTAGTGVIKIFDGYDGAGVIVQPDGKIVLSGTLLNFRDVPPTLLLARYNPNGSLDSSFGAGGKITYRMNNLDTYGSYGQPVALQSDGKMLVAGVARGVGGYVARFDSNGSLDLGFGASGVAAVEGGPDRVFVQSDNKIVVVNNDNFTVIRLTSDGSADPGFGNGGISTHPVISSGANAWSAASAMQEDDRILVTGYFGIYPPDPQRIALIRVATRNDSPFDYDGDGKTDFSVWRPRIGTTSPTWYVAESGSGQMVATEFPVDRTLVPADYDGDGITDIAAADHEWTNVTEQYQWYVKNSSTGVGSDQIFGLLSDVLLPADYDGDGKADYTAWRPSEGTWHIAQSSNGGVRAQQWGLPGDKPTPADFDGDGRTDLAVFRPSEGKWYVANIATGSVSVIGWGLDGDIPVSGDYSGDGKADFAVYRPSNNSWYRMHSSDFSMRETRWGLPNDIITPGDYDGDGKLDLAVFRPSEGKWYVLTATNSIITQSFGLFGDIPTPSAFVY